MPIPNIDSIRRAQPFLVAMQEIENKYNQLGGLDGFGKELTGVQPCIDGIGYYSSYEYGKIFWYPQIGAFEVHGDILGKYENLNSEQGPLGYPISDTKDDFIATYNMFQNGAIILSRDTGVHAILNPIFNKYNQPLVGWHGKLLNYPTSEQYPTKDPRAIRQDFQGSIGFSFPGGAIFSHPDLGTFIVSDKVYQRYAELGFENSYLGYPVSDTTSENLIDRCKFERGTIEFKYGTDLKPRDIPDSVKLCTETANEELRGWACVTLNTDGTWIFEGHVHNNTWGNFRYEFTASLTVPDPEGNIYRFSNRDELNKNPVSDKYAINAFGERNFHFGGKNPKISQYWDILKNNQLIGAINYDLTPPFIG